MVLRTWSEALKDYLDLIEKEEKGVLL